ncbi:Caudovirales tail fiber assembly protein [Pseudomonas fluorescens]|jgi:hypothetical protein|uniref:hypothetical protein n=1 Tax=Pseudomonas fluorescens group TaxID=136843 RepID=UPI0005DADB73|nr:MULTISPECIES: hypothetical protein [Pseudomonas fluorescens group]KJH87521.1 Caudovirales tail fiber assembly protein [Pseudomonas fluorescens]MBI6620468.1 phage tail protein [Pseudomonas corrugata]MBI6690986.1 phage tail protein [Pseudomonas corrugata]
MDTRYYSKTTGCTYLTSLHGANMPTDAVPIDEERFLSVIGNPPSGKIRGHDAQGLPTLIDPLPPTADELSVQERSWRDAEIERVEWLRERHRDQLDIGELSTLTPEQFGELLGHIKALRDWPQSQNFPDNQYRPIAPAWIAEQAR